ncbi:MAG: aspartate aminotransferase family protein [Cyclobacteriaceae bacterium]|nr:aspartate aminotransferase family protein [Cyclobacteriaceae bacterium]
MSDLAEKRRRLVSNGVGIFNPSTAESAKNAIITDANGRKLIDFAGGIGVVNAGHCPPPVVKAVQEQAAKLMHTCFNVATYEKYLELAQILVDLFPHGDAGKVMLTNTGAEAVENAIKIARQYTKRQAIICFTEAFHGRSMMAMSLTSKTGYKKNCGPFAPEIYRIPFPNMYKLAGDKNENDFAMQCLNDLEAAFKTMVDPNSVAAIIIEPVQGEGGFNVTPVKYLQGLRKICDQYGILLIIDEVQSGFGRTAKWAAYMHYDIEPDLSTWAKSMGSGMPIGAVIGRKEVMDGAAPGTIGGTYPGNPVCCAAAIATINYMKEIDINGLGQKVGEVIRKKMLEWQKQYPQTIGDVRGLGAMLAMELVHDGDPANPATETTSKIIWKAAEKGLLILGAGTYGNVIRILSPLTIERPELEKGLHLLGESIHEVINPA